MKRKLFFFIAAICAAFIACGACLIPTARDSASVAFADGFESLVFNNGVVEFGVYPQVYDPTASARASEFGNGFHTIDGKRYYVSQAGVDPENEGTISSGALASSLSGQLLAFRFEPIKWVIYADEPEYYELVTANVIDKKPFGWSYNSFITSDICYWLDGEFAGYESRYFTDAEKSRIMPIIVNDVEHRAVLPTREITVRNDYPSDFAILSILSSHLGYDHAPYWSMNAVSGNRVTVFWQNSESTDCLPSDDKIGVRPVIRLQKSEQEKANYNGGGGTSVDKSTNDSTDKSVDKSADKSSSKSGASVAFNVDPALPLGITFIGLGAAGYIVLFTMWAKKLKQNPDFVPKKWYFVIIAVVVLVSIIGLTCFSCATVGGGGNTAVGWYQGNTYDCVGWGERLAMNLTRDGKVYRYVADAWEDSATNYLFRRQDGVGTYTYSGGKLTIYAAPEWHLSSWEMPVTVYTDEKGMGSFIKHEGYVGTAYQWYHYSNIDSGGIREIRNKDTDIRKW